MKARTIGKPLIFGLGAACLLIMLACSSEVKRHPGFVTDTVKGRLAYSSDASDGKPFMVVRERNQTLIEGSDGYLTRISAVVIHPDEIGDYLIPFRSTVKQLDVMYIYRDHIPVTATFKRTLGVGEYEFDVDFESDPKWRNSYYLLIKPILIDYIVEKRYLLSPDQQQFLGDWMDKTEQLIEK